MHETFSYLHGNSKDTTAKAHKHTHKLYVQYINTLYRGNQNKGNNQTVKRMNMNCVCVDERERKRETERESVYAGYG